MEGWRGLGKVKVSIVYTTCRAGGIDLLFHTLKNQTFKDFELVTCDGLYDLRRDLVTEFADKSGITMKYLPDRGEGMYYGSMTAFNTCLMKCEGELVLHLEDYVYANPDWIDRHWALWEKIKGRKNALFGMLGLRHQCSFPEWIGQPDPIMMDNEILCKDPNILITAFKKPVEEIDFKSLVVMNDEVYKNNSVMITDEIGAVYPFSTNIYSNWSMPLGLFVILNGYDESFDRFEKGLVRVGGDPHLSTRAEMVGMRFFVDLKNEWYHLNHAQPFLTTWRHDNYETFKHKMKRLERYYSLFVMGLHAQNSFDLEKMKPEVIMEVEAKKE